jgi:hypothetical protein
VIDLVHRFIVPAAYTLLPEPMRSREATAMLLAIALQESNLEHRRQLDGGPARSLWQFDPGSKAAFSLLFSHASTSTLAREVCRRLNYRNTTDREALRRASEHNDVLACAMARLLLWTLPAALPGRDAFDESWHQYLEAWRPGDPHPETWSGHFRRAWDRVG